MLNTLSFDMKTPNNGDFLRNYTVQAFYLQNTLKTRDTQYDFSEKSGNSPFLYTILVKINKSISVMCGSTSLTIREIETLMNKRCTYE